MKHNKTIGVVAGLLVLGTVQVSQASLVTIGNVTDNGGGNYTIQSAAGSVPDATLESFLGLIPGTLDLLAVTVDPELVTQGSALKKTQFMQAGDTLSFDWVWSTEEDTNVDPSIFRDYAFYTMTFGGATVIADALDVDGTSGTVSWTAPTEGTMALGLGVVDVGDIAVPSYLNVDNIVVPEPATMGLIAFCTAGLYFARRFFHN